MKRETLLGRLSLWLCWRSITRHNARRGLCGAPAPGRGAGGAAGGPSPAGHGAASSAPARCNSAPGLPVAGEHLQLLYSINGGVNCFPIYPSSKIKSELTWIFCFSTELENSGMRFLTGTNFLPFFQASREKGCILLPVLREGRAASAQLLPWRCMGPLTTHGPAQRLGHAP